MRPDPQERSRAVAATFDRVARAYDSVGVPWFTPIAEHLVGDLGPAPGERVLDVGSGRGAATFALAAAVGPHGRVTAIDLAPGMVEALHADVAARGLQNVRIAEMDAAAPDLEPAGFDVLASSLVLFFLPDPAAALSRWHELLAPGGRIGVSTFGTQDPAWRAVDDVFTPYLPQHLLDARTSGRSGPFGSDEGVESLFAAAGFTAVRTVRREVSVTLRDVAQWQEWTMSHGQRALWSAVPDQARDDVLAAAARALQGAQNNRGAITLGQEVRYTLGQRAP